MTKNQTPPEQRAEESLGSRFRRARTDLGKTLPEAAEVTRINPATLAALESDNFAKLPAEVFTRGFVKLYAQYLGLDISETLKLYTNQENLDLERPADQPYRRDILSGTAMASPLGIFKANPRLKIVAILLTVLVAFYVLGAIMKAVQKHPDQAAPENELAKSLVDSNTPPVPRAPGEPLPAPVEMEQAGVPGTAALPANPPELQAGAGTPPAGAPAANPPMAPATGVTAGQPLALPPAETPARETAQVAGERRPSPPPAAAESGAGRSPGASSAGR